MFTNWSKCQHTTDRWYVTAINYFIHFEVRAYTFKFSLRCLKNNFSVHNSFIFRNVKIASENKFQTVRGTIYC